ncbi:osmolarity sensor protein EnvZ [mine drainage metagenome]|uniref:histidine kinase n=1 Tax=mine drainage metagenome TaxID=410659 RepID=A0A1J5RQ23_9ZZZZ
MRLVPETLVGRTVLILLVGLVLSQVAAVVLFGLNHHAFFLRMTSQRRAERIASAVQVLNGTAAARRLETERALDGPGFRVRWLPQAGPPPSGPVPGEARDLEMELHRLMPGRTVLVRQGFHPPPGFFPRPPDGAFAGPDDFGPPPDEMEHPHPPPLVIWTRLDDGTWLRMVARAAQGEGFLHPGFYGPLLTSMVVVLLFSLLAARRAARPLALMEAAASRLGRDVNAPPVAVSGPREVRAAAMAFNEMQARLRRFIDDRTQMVAAISHDLRTPITRLKLRAEFIDDEEQRGKVLSDLAEMEAMIASTLAFARDDAAREMREPLDLAQMLADLADEFGGHYSGPAALVITAGPLGLKRTFANLIGNAVKYGGTARIGLERKDGGHVRVIVDDDGPGIPEAELERVFAPFYRVEASRNRETGGTGLGLAVARSAVRAHGGDITLKNRAGGGLRVTVLLPV